MIKPRAIRLEAASICQLRCPSCPTTSRAIHPAVGSGFLKLRDFQALLDENRWIRTVELSNYGEIFLNPDFSDILREAFRRRVRLTANNGVNLNRATGRQMEDLVRYRFRSLTCSLDGASNETYAQYRVRGNLAAVLRNIERINAFKRAYRSRYPLLEWQFIVFGHNEHEIPAARALARQLRMAFRLKLSWDEGFSPVRDESTVARETGLGVATRSAFRGRHGTEYLGDICHQLWDRPQINWDGKILGCCRNFWGDFGGNAFADGLLNSLNNEKMDYARAMLLGKRETRADIPCSTCEIYLHRVASEKPLRRGVSWWLARCFSAVRYAWRRR